MRRKKTMSLWVPLFVVFFLCAGCSEKTVTPDDPISIGRVVDDIVYGYIDDDDPGIVVVSVFEGQTTHSKGYGMADIARNLPATPQTPYFIGSITKQFTAMATMMCVEAGLFDYDDKINDYFPNFPAHWSDITIHHLLTHTSGLPDFLNDLGYNPDGVTRQQALNHVLANNALFFQPGKQWRYCNTGYAILAELVQKRSGQQFEDFAKEKIFDPLGMTHTLYYGENAPEISNRAIGYNTDGSLWDWNMRISGSGGIISTAEDMLKWDQALYGESLVSRSTLDLAWTEHVYTNNDGRAYGYGFEIQTLRGFDSISHGGSYRAFRAHYMQFPEEEFALIILSNGTHGQMLWDIIDAIYNFYFPAI